MQILSWNVRGLCSRDRRVVVKKVIQLYKAHIIILQETKMMHCTDFDIQQLCGSNNFRWTFQQSVGSSGRMIILWNKDILVVNDSLVGDYTLSIACTDIADGFQWILTNVYGPNKHQERCCFWEELDNVCRLWDLPRCIRGDFNTVLCCGEKKNCSKVTKSMKSFASFIEKHELIDLPLKGARYTWSNNQSVPIMCRLDRFLLSPSFELKFPLASQLAKPRPTSDHIPLILDLSDPSWGPSPFRFEILWFLENGFVEILENWWNSFCFVGTPSEIFWLKLKELKGLLKVWNKDTFGRTTTKLQNILSDIQVIDSVSESVCLSQDQVNAKISLQADFEKVTLMEETAWRIKSKSKWIKEGDRNTAHFMRIAAAKRRYNRIRQLYIDGVMISDKTILQEHIVAFYRTLFTEDMLIRPELEGINFDQINSEEATILESNFTEDEIY
ncbi:uncharacterized protein LOC113311518 [Papaver somniferum]|uniref:uncharacterized protein LOC113311518 n=1 Tax=Papaver somniferum TaxID=3469 RepID=UPI000E70081E|nr:uncharacterized protein LOC113311518 [Papaver somniferum]